MALSGKNVTGAGGLIETLRGRVAVGDCNDSGRMNVDAYVARISDATVTLSHALGFTAEYIAAKQCGLVTSHQDIAYIGELEAGDLLMMLGGVLSVDPEQILFLHHMLRVEDGAVVLSAKVLMRGIHLERRTSVALDAPTVERARRLLVREADT